MATELKTIEEINKNFSDVLIAQKERTIASDEKHATLVDKIETQNKAADELIKKMASLEEANTKANEKSKDLEIAFARKFGDDNNEKYDLETKESVIRSHRENQLPSDFKYGKVEYDLHKKAFDIWFKGGQKGLYNSGHQWTPAEQKFINTIVDPQGGFLVSPQYSQDVLPKKFNGRAIIDMVDRMTIGGTSYTEPVDAGDYSDAAWSNELGSAPSDASNEDFQEISYYPHAIIYPKKISRTSLEDSFVGSDYYINKMQEGSTRTIAHQLLLGTANDVPRGILTYDSGTNVTGQVEQVTSGTNDSVVWKDLMAVLPKALKTGYQANAQYLMNQNTWRDLLTTEDDNSRYMMSEILAMFTLADKTAPSDVGTNVPIRLDVNMPDVADGSLSVIYGDFKAAYLMVERVGFSLIRDETNPKFINYFVRRRVGGSLRIGEAIKILVTA